MKWIKNLIRKFTPRPKITERITLNAMYRYDNELIKFVKERMGVLSRSSIVFVISWGDFPADQYGKVQLVRNGKVIEGAKLMRRKHNLIYWKFDE